jgi:hypothetical protein
MKAIGQRSHELALDAIEHATEGASSEDHRYRLEHSLAVNDGQLERMARLGVITAIQPGFPGVVWYQDDIRRLADEEGLDRMFRWPDYLASGVVVAASPYNPDPERPELFDPSHVAPMGLLYRAATQVGLDDTAPEPWMLTRALSPEQMLPLMTVNGAYAAGVEGTRGRLAVGTIADLVILSLDPLAVDPVDLPSIEVLATMVGGVAEYVRPGADGLDDLARGPGSPATPADRPRDAVVNVAPGARVTASSELAFAPASNAVDGTGDHWNADGLPPQWIMLRLERPVDLVAVRLVVAQDPPGRTTHKLLVRRVGEALKVVATFRGTTADGDVLTWTPKRPLRDVDLVRVVSTRMPDLFPAWREIEVLAIGSSTASGAEAEAWNLPSESSVRSGTRLVARQPMVRSAERVR